MTIYDDNPYDHQLVDPFATTVSNEDMAAFMPKPEVDLDPLESKPESKTLFGKELFQAIFDSVSTKPANALGAPVKLTDGEAEGIANAIDLDTKPKEPELALEDLREDLSLEEFTEPLDELTDVYNSISSLGLVDRGTVQQLESSFEGIISSHINPNFISTLPSTQGVDVSLEAIGSKIKEILENLIDRIVKSIKNVIEWITTKFSKGFTDVVPSTLLAERTKLIDRARNIDSVYGRLAFGRALPQNDSIAIVSSSAEDYVIKSLDAAIVRTMTENYTQGKKMMLTSNGLATHIGNLGDTLKVLSADIAGTVDKLANTEVDKWTDFDDKVIWTKVSPLMKWMGVTPNWESPSETIANYRNKVTTAFRTKTTGAPKTFVAAANIGSPFENYSKIVSDIRTNLNRAETGIKRLERKAGSLGKDKDYTVNTKPLMAINKLVVHLLNLLNMYTSYNGFYTSYVNSLRIVVFNTNRKLDMINAKSMSNK